MQKILADSIASVMEIIGDKWTPLLLSIFFNEGTVRYRLLLETGISPRTLSQRLTALEEQGIVVKYQPPNAHCEYRLTDKGRSLLPVLRSMEDWATTYKP